MRGADIEDPQACPRGLRHSFGVAAVTAGVPPRECEVCAGTGELTGPYVQAHANAHVRGAPRDERGRVRKLSVVPVRARRGPRRADA